ncbi:hypothetical protein D3C76_1332110 [compost metagenome]
MECLKCLLVLSLVLKVDAQGAGGLAITLFSRATIHLHRYFRCDINRIELVAHIVLGLGTALISRLA